jgi:Protein of unknown function (Gmx_para_CXXCG)
MRTFYDLRTPKNFVELSEGNDWEGITCPIDSGHQRAGRRITELHLHCVSKKVADFSSTILSDIVITDHALDVLRQEGLTGFNVKPPVICSNPKLDKRFTIPKLWEFLVTGKAGNAHPDSGIVLKWKCASCGLFRYSAFEHGLIVNEATYDGSDFFTVTEYPKHVLVSERAKNVIEGNSLSNVQFVESSKLQWPEGVIKP